ncbi:MFS transporter [Amycolatopsis alkalitolerans]|uniref:MHS family MFS transporter n=1 Tax=Amycolatopsis alkalitolerans TaxID=2547244 RepID=A0A5C4M2C1_9PSEU|nr:MFS transporter [Amycolatopsis alkalitolerans]TNC24935.1 MHS family MFS transporter [Amycolatopsis alkalitolerans]
MTQPTTAQIRRVAVSGMLGTAMEYYDFLLFGTLAALVFNKLFFPSLAPLVGTIAAFGSFTAGYLARPIGGLIIGHFGDRIGRKSMLLLTMTTMGVSSFLIGVLPTHATIGIWAPVLLVVLRCVQGLALGGEWGGAVLMTSEHAGNRRRGFWASFTVMGAPLGSLLSTVAVLAVSWLPSAQFLAWGWRIPFLFSIVLLAVGLFVRVRVSESPVFANRRQARTPARLPLVDVLRHPRNLILTTGLGLGPLVIQALWSTFVITYAVHNGHSKSSVLLALAIGSAISMPVLPAVAMLADRFGRRPVMLTGAVGTVVLAYPLFWMLGSGSTIGMIAALLLGRCVLQPIMYAPWPAVTAESFRTESRYTGASLGYQLASLLGGGFSPLIATSLLALGHGQTHYVALFIAACALLTVLSIWRIAETRDADLDEPATPRLKEPGDLVG